MKCRHVLYRFNFLYYTQPYVRHFGSSSVIEDFREIIEEGPGESLNSGECKSSSVNTTRSAYDLEQYDTVTEYLDSKPHLKDIKNQIPYSFINRKYVSHNNVFMVDKDVTGEIFETIRPFLQSCKGHIVEVNAGLGVLTDYLITAKLPRLRIYEGDTTLYTHLHTKINTCKSDAQLFCANLTMLWTMLFQDRNDNGNRISSLFEGISRFAWEDDPVMNIIVTISVENFLKHLMYSVIFQNSVAVYGRPQLFVIMPPLLYTKFFSSPDQGFFVYRSKSAIFQILFEHTLLLKVPKKAFLPWLKKSPKKTKSPYEPKKDDESCMFVVKLTGRRDLFQKIPPDSIKSLWFFVKKLMYKRKAGLIDLMERWVPGCGLKLIAHGYTIFTKCGSLSPDQYVELFNMFSSWPEFKQSSFSSDLNDHMMKMTESGVTEDIIVEAHKRSKKRAKEDEYTEEFDDSERGSVAEENLDDGDEKKR